MDTTPRPRSSAPHRSGVLSSRRAFLRTLAASAVSAPVIARAEAAQAAVDRALVRGEGSRLPPAAALKEEYLLSPELIYLNHASIGTTPKAVVEAHSRYLELCESHPSLYVWGAVWREVAEEARSMAAALTGCEPDDLAITHNTTEGFSILAQGLPLGPGDEVLFSSLNHAGAAVAWDGLAERRGFTVRRFQFPLGDAPGMTAEDVIRIHAEAIRPDTRVLVLPHVDNMIGLRHPCRGIAQAAREAGVEWVLVDGAQSAGMIPLDFRAMGVDAYAMSCHKWIQSPKGLGLLYMSPSLRSHVPRMWFKTPGDRMDGSARLYEDYSTRAWPAVVSLTDALTFQAALGEDEKTRRYASMWARVKARVDGDPALAWRSPDRWDLGSLIMAVEVRGAAAPELGARLLNEVGGVVRAFGGELNTLRVSPNLMTTDEELERFLTAATAGV